MHSTDVCNKIHRENPQRNKKMQKKKKIANANCISAIHDMGDIYPNWLTLSMAIRETKHLLLNRTSQPSTWMSLVAIFLYSDFLEAPTIHAVSEIYASK